MQERLPDAELRILEALWEQGPLPAGQVAAHMKKQTGWNRNTTYTLINRLIAKNLIERSEPGFICTPLIGKEAVRRRETETLLSRLFDGSKELFFASLLGDGNLSQDELDHLKQLLDGAESTRS
mgnify:CR=1 FL=1